MFHKLASPWMPLRDPRTWVASFAFWTAVVLVWSFLVVSPVSERGWGPLQSAVRAYAPFVVGTVVTLQLSTRFAALRGVAFWRAALLTVLAFGMVHTLVQLWLFDFPLAGIWAGTIGYGFQYAAIVGVGCMIQHRHREDEQRRELQAAQLRALRAQLQPHFLFNTLHTIGVAAKQDGATAARMTTLLGDLLRQTLRERVGGVVSLAEENELLQPYLQLQQLRFADRLRVDVDLPPEVLAGAVPDLLLQPLVENALQHGIEQRPGSGRVRVVGRRVGDHLLIEVHDDGVGVAANAGEPVLGTGLGATKARLAALYGDDASLSLRANDQGGTTASVILPWREVAHAA